MLNTYRRMEKQVHLHEFRFQFTRGQVLGVLAAGLLLSLIEPIATESITLSTYYPAPAGAYNNLVTTGNTWLARDNIPGSKPLTPSFVEMGGNNAVSPGTKLAVMNGRVGINVLDPSQMLEVNGNAQIDDNLLINNNETVGKNATIDGTVQIQGGAPTKGAVLTASDSAGHAYWNTGSTVKPFIRYVNNGQPPITVSASYCAVSYVFDLAPAGSGGDAQGCSAQISGPGQWTLKVNNQANCGFSCF